MIGRKDDTRKIGEPFSSIQPFLPFRPLVRVEPT